MLLVKCTTISQRHNKGWWEFVPMACISAPSLLSATFFPALSTEDICNEHLHRLLSLVTIEQLCFGSALELLCRRWFPPHFPPCQGSMGTPPTLFVTALAETMQQNSGKSTPSCFLVSDVFSLTSASVSVTHMNMEDEYKPSSEVMPNSTRDRLFNHEIIFTEEV